MNFYQRNLRFTLGHCFDFLREPVEVSWNQTHQNESFNICIKNNRTRASTHAVSILQSFPGPSQTISGHPKDFYDFRDFHDFYDFSWFCDFQRFLRFSTIFAISYDFCDFLRFLRFSRFFNDFQRSTENDFYDFFTIFCRDTFFSPGEVTINFSVHRAHRTGCLIFLENDFFTISLLRFHDREIYDFFLVGSTLEHLCPDVEKIFHKISVKKSESILELIFEENILQISFFLISTVLYPKKLLKVGLWRWKANFFRISRI